MALFRLITNGLAPLTLLGAIIAYLSPETFIWIKPWFQYLFAATMFALGVVLQPADLRETLKRPRAIGLGVLAQYTIMPLLGLAAALLSGLPPQLALALSSSPVHRGRWRAMSSSTWPAGRSPSPSP